MSEREQFMRIHDAIKTLRNLGVSLNDYDSDALETLIQWGEDALSTPQTDKVPAAEGASEEYSDVMLQTFAHSYGVAMSARLIDMMRALLAVGGETVRHCMRNGCIPKVPAAEGASENDDNSPLAQAQRVCAQAYQIVGSLLDDLGQFGTERAEKILDNLSQHLMIHDDLLPWPSFATPPAKANPAAGAEPGDLLSPAELIVRDCCEAEPCDPGKPTTVTIHVDDLRDIVERHLPPAPSERDAEDALAAVMAERARQDAQWGGARSMTKDQLNAAAKVLAECMDYPWEHMPEQGRQKMRDHAASVIEAAQPAAPAVAESHDNAMYVAAMQTLLNLGYHWDGGKEWKARNSIPPEGKQS